MGLKNNLEIISRSLQTWDLYMEKIKRRDQMKLFSNIILYTVSTWDCVSRIF